MLQALLQLPNAVARSDVRRQVCALPGLATESAADDRCSAGARCGVMQRRGMPRDSMQRDVMPKQRRVVRRDLACIHTTLD